MGVTVAAKTATYCLFAQGKLQLRAEIGPNAWQLKWAVYLDLWQKVRQSLGQTEAYFLDSLKFPYRWVLQYDAPNARLRLLQNRTRAKTSSPVLWNEDSKDVESSL